MSLLEDQDHVRKQHYGFLLGLAHKALGAIETAKHYFAEVLKINAGHLMAGLETPA